MDETIEASLSLSVLVIGDMTLVTRNTADIADLGRDLISVA